MNGQGLPACGPLRRRTSRRILFIALLVCLFLAVPVCRLDAFGGFSVSQVLSAIIDLIKGDLTAEKYIPPRIRDQVVEFAAPWQAPEFVVPADAPAGHDGNVSGSRSEVPGAWQAPPGESPFDGDDGSARYEQVEPTDGAAAERRADTLGSF